MTDATSTPATWTIDSQVQRTQVDPSGNLVRGYDIAFHTGEGHAGTVFLPDTRYNVTNARAAIQAQADLLDGVGALTSES